MEKLNVLLQDLKKKAKKEEESKRKYIKQLEAKTKELDELKKELGCASGTTLSTTGSSTFLATTSAADLSTADVSNYFGPSPNFHKDEEKKAEHKRFSASDEDEERYGLTEAKWGERLFLGSRV